MQVKARVTFWCCMGVIEGRRKNEGLDVLCAMSVVKDLLRMQGISPEPSKNTQPSIIDLRSWPRSYLTK